MRLKERITELEGNQITHKTDAQVEKSRLEINIAELESQRNESHKNEKILEERLK